MSGGFAAMHQRTTPPAGMHTCDNYELAINYHPEASQADVSRPDSYAHVLVFQKPLGVWASVMVTSSEGRFGETYQPMASDASRLLFSPFQRRQRRLSPYAFVNLSLLVFESGSDSGRTGVGVAVAVGQWDLDPRFSMQFLETRNFREESPESRKPGSPGGVRSSVALQLADLQLVTCCNLQVVVTSCSCNTVRCRFVANCRLQFSKLQLGAWAWTAWPVLLVV